MVKRRPRRCVQLSGRVSREDSWRGEGRGRGDSVRTGRFGHGRPGRGQTGHPAVRGPSGTRPPGVRPSRRVGWASATIPVARAATRRRRHYGPRLWDKRGTTCGFPMTFPTGVHRTDASVEGFCAATRPADVWTAGDNAAPVRPSARLSAHLGLHRNGTRCGQPLSRVRSHGPSLPGTGPDRRPVRDPGRGQPAGAGRSALGHGQHGGLIGWLLRRGGTLRTPEQPR